MKPDELYIRTLIREQVVKLSTEPVHRCMGGHVVPFGCEESVEDIENRMSDTSFHRDLQDYRTSARDSYNGILRVLRRTLKAAKNLYAKEHPPEPEETEEDISIIQV